MACSPWPPPDCRCCWSRPTPPEETIVLARDLVDSGAPAVLLGDDLPADLPCPVVDLPSGGAEIGAYTALVAAQLATVALTRHRGRDPDARTDHKVTVTS